MPQPFIAPVIETVRLGSLTVPRVWTGLWQLSSTAWGTASATRVRQEMGRYVDRGYTAFGKSMFIRVVASMLKIIRRHGQESSSLHVVLQFLRELFLLMTFFRVSVLKI
jgi:hypothetical protein